MSTADMIDSFEQSFELGPEAQAQVLALIEDDRRAGRLRSASDSGVTAEQALHRFATACSAMTEVTPKLKADGVARRGVARSNLEKLLKDLRNLRAAIHGVQEGIGDEAYDLMPLGAFSALRTLDKEPAASFENGIATFADFLPDPLKWQSKVGYVSMTVEWVSEIEPMIEQAIASFDGPGKSRGSAGRLAGRRILFLLCLLDRAEAKTVRRPRRKHLAAWLELLFDITGEARPKNIEVLAKNVLSDGFPKDPADWRHPEPPWPGTPRTILRCTIGTDGVQHWSGALVDRYGQRENSE